MSKFRQSALHLSTALIPCRLIPFLFFLLLFHLVQAHNISFAGDYSSKNYKLTYEKNLLSISASEADLKNILIDIAERAGISIRYPESLDNKITLKLSNISLKKALKRLLKDFNYSIIYSGSNKQAVISDVYILKKINSAPTPRTITNESRTASRIESYEKRIESLKRNLSSVGENSSRGQRYLNQIKSYEKTIERLKNQIN